MITQTFYIGTGRKHAMYTLRMCRESIFDGRWVCHDSYICNLAATAKLAEEKAEIYLQAMRERMVETEDFKIVFALEVEQGLNKRRGTLSVADTRKMEIIEAGVFPFGKHVGTKIIDAPDNYILFFADKAKEELDAVMSAMCAICMGIALDRGLIAKREAVRAERLEVDSKSNHIGSIKERRVFKGELFMSFAKMEDGMVMYHINKVRVGDDIVTYIGKSLGVVGETIEFKATIVAHDLYNGIKSTKVNRPA